MIWRLTDSEAKPLKETSLASEELLERHLEDWIEAHPEMLEEELMVIGRQVAIPDAGDRIDLLAVDPQGALVVIELKRGAAGGTVDMQALRYASYVSRWSYSDIRRQAENYASSTGKQEDFFDQVEEFIDEEAELNAEQRILIAGRRLRDKIGSVALWLLERDVNIKVVELVPYRDEAEALFVAPTVVVPPPTAEDYEIGSVGGDEPWQRDGRDWHLNHRCNEQTAALLEELESVITQLPDVTSKWRQKFYMAFYQTGIRYRWVVVRTRKTQLNVQTRWPMERWTEPAVAEQLGLDESLANVERAKGPFDQITVKLSPGYDVTGEAFEDFIREAYEIFPSIWQEEVSTTADAPSNDSYEK